MKSLIYGLLTTSLFPLLQSPAIAQPPAIRQLTPLQIQRLSRDLVPSRSQDFFNRGQRELEREIQNLPKRQRLLKEPVLRVNQDTQPQTPPQIDQFNPSLHLTNP